MRHIRFLTVIAFTLLVVVAYPAMAFASEVGHENLGEHLPLWSCIPFAGMLLSIAILPLVRGEWWEEHQLHVAVFWALIFLIPFGIVFGAHLLTFQILETILLDYLPFIILLFGLFVASGGIVLKGDLAGDTKTNVIMLLIGALLASWIGTTGVAMLMIRPIIRANDWRDHKAHTIIFFIFMVANIGGCLTPVGDPPLFLGFLRGVPFFWTMRLLPMMIFNIVILTIAYIFIDRHFIKKERQEGDGEAVYINREYDAPLKIEGTHNFIFILMIVGAVILNGVLAGMPGFTDPATGELTGITMVGVTLPWNSIIQMVIILIAAFLSMKTTKKEIREFNSFTFAPIAEVAKLFIGIFLTMIPALALLKAHGADLGLSQPWQFFWITGALSSFLDNAPTYLVFLTTAGSIGFSEGVATSVGVVAPKILMAVSAGAVFMGANTYIGNAPNFMVKSIAEENGIKMPSFFGYMVWSLAILIPLFFLDMFVFFM